MPPDAATSRVARFQRRRRWRRVLAIVVGFTAIGGVATAFALTHDASSRDAHSTGGTNAGKGATSSTQAVVSRLNKLKAHRPPRAISNAAPLRVWVGGDSLSGELGPSLGTLLAPTGVVQVTVDFKVSSGLHNNDVRDWPTEIANQMTKYSPDVAIFMIGANDAGIVGGDPSSWEPAYKARLDFVLGELVGDHHRTVYLVGPPPMGSSDLDRGARALGLLMAQEASQRPDVVYVDAYSMFAGPDGGYASRLDLSALAASPMFPVQVHGDLSSVQVRIGDGVHFTDDGATYIAYKVARLLDAQWDILRQAGGAPLSVKIENGGGSIPGYTRPRYYSTSSTSPPTEPPTSAATTPTTVSPPPSTVTSSPTTVKSPPTTIKSPPTTKGTGG